MASSAHGPRTPRCEPGPGTPSWPQAPCSGSNPLFPGPVHKPTLGKGRERPQGCPQDPACQPQQVSGPLGSVSDQDRGTGAFSPWRPSWAISTQHRHIQGCLQAAPLLTQNVEGGPVSAAATPPCNLCPPPTAVPTACPHRGNPSALPWTLCPLRSCLHGPLCPRCPPPGRPPCPSQPCCCQPLCM